MSRISLAAESELEIARHLVAFGHRDLLRRLLIGSERTAPIQAAGLFGIEDEDPVGTGRQAAE